MLQPIRHLSQNMRPYLQVLILLVFFLAGAQPPASAAESEKRFALVVGNASYEAHTLATAANDADLIARTLQAAGFEVIHSRDLKREALHQAFNNFLDKLSNAGPGSIAFVYFAGYGLQSEGENYLLPVDARIAVASDLPRYGVRLSDIAHRLAALRSRASIIVLDAARQSPFVVDAAPPAAGLSWLEPEANTLIAFNAAPGMLSPDTAQGYGPYARALAEMVKEAGFALPETFVRVRLRVHELTRGAQVPWHSWNFDQQPVLSERPVDQLQRARLLERETWFRSQTMASLGPQDAYFSALIRDNFDAYADFLADHGRDPLSKRILAMLAVRREAITWRRTCQADVSESYWTYLERYPAGAHIADARRRLEKLGASVRLPAKFRRLEYDVPPPLPNELGYSGPSALSLADAAFLPEPGPGPRDIIGDPPEFVLSAAARPVASDPPLMIPVPPTASSRTGQRDNPLVDFDTTQMRPSIDDRPVNADLAPVRPSASVAAKAGPTGQPDKVVAPTIPRGPVLSAGLPSWAILDPVRAVNAGVGSGPVPGTAALPAWTDQGLIPSDQITPSSGEPMWTGSLAGSGPAFPTPTRLAQRGRRWVMLTRENAIPLPLARPGDRSRTWAQSQARISGAASSASPITHAARSVDTSGGEVRPSQATVPATTTPKPRPVRPSPISKPANARAGSPGGTSSAATTGSR